MKLKTIISNDCPKTDGYLRSCIQDLTRQKYYLLEKFKNISELDEEVIEFLKEEEIVIDIPDSLIKNFPNIDLRYISNQLITSCLIHYDDYFDVDLLKKNVL